MRPTAMQAHQDKIIVKPFLQQETTASGLYIAGMTEHVNYGTVVDVDTGFYQAGKWVDCQVTEGEIVAYQSHKGVTIETANGPVLIISESDILARGVTL